MLLAIVILLVVIVVLLCVPLEQRGPTVVKLVGVCALGAAVYYFGPLLFGLGFTGVNAARHSETAHLIAHWLSKTLAFLFWFIAALLVMAILFALVSDFWKKFRANPKEVSHRLVVWVGKAIIGFAAFCTYIVGMLVVIDRFYVAGLFVYLGVGTLAVVFFTWRKRRRLHTLKPVNPRSEPL
jgi:hypothetical protein